MRLYRLTRRPHADLSGAGGLAVTGRWHGKPAPVLYASESRALAMLEVLVHLEVDFTVLPDDYVFQVVDAPTDAIESVDQADLQPGGRVGDPAVFGAAWLEARRSALLRVPSVLIPRECNILVNPAHPAATRFESAIETDMLWDRRLFE